ERRRDRPAGAVLLVRRHAILEIEDCDVETTRRELTESQRALDHPRTVPRHEHQRAERSHQYDRGMPSTFWPRYASTRLLLNGANSMRRVSRNCRSPASSGADPAP